MSKTSKTGWERLAKLNDGDIDTSDISELGEDFFRCTELRVPVKQAVTIRLDARCGGVVQGAGRGLSDTHQSVPSPIHAGQAGMNYFTL